MIALAPDSTALDTATVIPRSLKEPVGLAPSPLRYTPQPVRVDSSGAGNSAVLPSYSVTTGVAPLTGNRPRYCPMRPRHMALLPFDPQHAGHGTHDIERTQLRDGPRQRRVGGGVRDDHEHRLGPPPGLVHRRDAHIVPGEHPGDRREHAGPIGDIQ